MRSPKHIVSTLHLNVRDIINPNQHYRALGDLFALTMMDIPIGGSSHQIPVSQCQGSGIYQQSGKKQKSFCGKRSGRDSILGRTLQSSLVSHAHSRFGQLAGRLWQLVAPGPEGIVPTSESVFQKLTGGGQDVDFLASRFSIKLDRLGKVQRSSGGNSGFSGGSVGSVV